jgi:hypothetical protein
MIIFYRCSHQSLLIIACGCTLKYRYTDSIISLTYIVLRTKKKKIKKKVGNSEKNYNLIYFKPFVSEICSRYTLEKLFITKSVAQIKSEFSIFYVVV